jgi:hypothetical protein
LFQIVYSAIIAAFVLMTLELQNGSSALNVLISFSGGLIYGGGFALIGCVFLLGTTYGSFYLFRYIKSKIKSR